MFFEVSQLSLVNRVEICKAFCALCAGCHGNKAGDDIYTNYADSDETTQGGREPDPPATEPYLRLKGACTQGEPP